MYLNLIILNNADWLASNVSAMPSFTVCKNALCSTFAAIPSATNCDKLEYNFSVLINGDLLILE